MHTDKKIKKIKISDEGDSLRLTFDWPQGITQVHIATQPDPNIGKLFTLQEYKKQAGYHTLKIQGITTYYIYPSQWENGEDIFFEASQMSYTNQTIIHFSMEESIRQYKNYRVILQANYPVPADIICYVKKENALPQNVSDGMVYCFSEPLEPNQPITRIIRTAKNEYINFFIKDVSQNDCYQLEGAANGII